MFQDEKKLIEFEQLKGSSIAQTVVSKGKQAGNRVAKVGEGQIVQAFRIYLQYSGRESQQAFTFVFYVETGKGEWEEQREWKGDCCSSAAGFEHGSDVDVVSFRDRLIWISDCPDISAGCVEILLNSRFSSCHAGSLPTQPNCLTVVCT